MDKYDKLDKKIKRLMAKCERLSKTKQPTITYKQMKLNDSKTKEQLINEVFGGYKTN